MSPSRERAICNPNNEIGQERFRLYKSAFSWISKSIEDGYYLEAINIIESLICDRLESHLSLLLEENYGFKNLGNLIDKIKQHETDEQLHLIITQDLDEWRKKRNKAAHEMVKIEKGIEITWQERVKINKQIAERGLELVRQIDKRIRQLKAEY